MRKEVASKCDANLLGEVSHWIKNLQMNVSQIGKIEKKSKIIVAKATSIPSSQFRRPDIV